MIQHVFRNALCSLVCLFASGAVAQGTGDWSVAAAQGYEEHVVYNGPGNSFNISCNFGGDPETLGKPRMFVEIIGKNPAPHSHVDVFVIDEVYRFPVDDRGSINLDCRVCEGNFAALWAKIRKSSAIVVQYQNGQNVSFKTRGAAKALSTKPCRS